MVVSHNSGPHRKEFNVLLDETVRSLRNESSKSASKFAKLGGTLLENTVADFMNISAKGTPFENTIEVVSGHKFPDIVAKKYYGVEVKTTAGDSWTSTGSSIMEGTRVPSVERIFLMFAKLGKPIDFRCKAYEECLSEVVVTHSPRYLINMDLKSGDTIFDKLGVPYDTLRNMDNPVAPVVDYYKKKLKPGEKLWWLDNAEPQTANMIIRFWNTLSKDEREEYTAKGYAYFPEVISSQYNKFSMYLATERSVLCPNVRDIYSAGGQGMLEYRGKEFYGISKSIVKVISYLELIEEELTKVSSETLARHWERSVPKSTNARLELWAEMVCAQVGNKFGKLPLMQIIMSEFSR